MFDIYTHYKLISIKTINMKMETLTDFSPSDFTIINLEEAKDEVSTLLDIGEITGEDIPDDLLDAIIVSEL